MWSEPIHLPVGTGLNMVINLDSLAAAVPMARILVQDNATTFTDEGCPLVLRVTEQGLIRLLGNGPEAEAILADGYAHTAVYQSGVVSRIADDILHAPYHGAMLAHFLEGKVHELLDLLLESLPAPPLDSIGDRITLSVCAKPVREISQARDYSHVNHFVNARTRHFGISPGRMRSGQVPDA